MTRFPSAVRRLVRACVPPVLLRPFVRRFFRVRWTGSYATWSEARAATKGYEDPVVFARILAAARLARDGACAYERDGVAFAEPAVNAPLLAGLRHAAAGGRLSVLDFGGSLGSLYWQHRAVLAPALSGGISWRVVEQPHFVEAGQREFSNTELRFFHTIEEGCAQEQPDVLLLAGVLPYLEDPHALLRDLARRRFRHVLIDRTGVTAGQVDRLTVQRAPRNLHSATYPCWFLSRDRLLAPFAADYVVRAEYETLDGQAWGLPFRGFHLERRAP